MLGKKNLLRVPKTKFSAQSRSVCPRRTEARSKRHRQEIEMREKGKGSREGMEYLPWIRTKDWIERR